MLVFDSYTIVRRLLALTRLAPCRFLLAQGLLRCTLIAELGRPSTWNTAANGVRMGLPMLRDLIEMDGVYSRTVYIHCSYCAPRDCEPLLDYRS